MTGSSMEDRLSASIAFLLWECLSEAYRRKGTSAGGGTAHWISGWHSLNHWLRSWLTGSSLFFFFLFISVRRHCLLRMPCATRPSFSAIVFSYSPYPCRPGAHRGQWAAECRAHMLLLHHPERVQAPDLPACMMLQAPAAAGGTWLSCWQGLARGPGMASTRARCHHSDWHRRNIASRPAHEHPESPV